MKTITTLTAIAALIAGVSIATAQNAGAPAPADASPPASPDAGMKDKKDK
jgi:hypothetical protein